MNKIITYALIFFVLILGACSQLKKRKNYADLFVENIHQELTNFKEKTGTVEITIPDEIEGYLVIAAPYSISSFEEVKIGQGGLGYERMVDLIQDDSSFHIFIINNNKLITHRKWEDSPVVFNRYFYAPLTIKGGSVTFFLAEGVLKNILVTK